jgi:hypothetical protein
MRPNHILVLLQALQVGNKVDAAALQEVGSVTAQVSSVSKAI